jgi:hypothetical protein
MVVGMFLLVWSATSHLATPGLWDDQTKVLLWMLELVDIIEANLTYRLQSCTRLLQVLLS